MHSNFNDLKNENMTAKEWLFENYPQVKDEWNKTGHDDNYMVRMMEEYHQAKLKLLGIANVVGRSEQCSGCEESTGETKLWCCNHCGKRVESF